MKRKPKPEKLADVRFKGADGKLHRRWTVRLREPKSLPWPYALYDEERKEFPGRVDYGRYVRPLIRPNWTYWKYGTKENVQNYINRTNVSTFERQRVEERLDRGRA
jgi:hypothetical protein